MFTRKALTSSIAGTVLGSGPSMLLIHGVGMNADYWENLTPALSARFRLTIIDMPGHGESKALNNDAPLLASYTDTIAESIKTSTIITGHSMGALIALDLATRYPHLADGIGVLNGIYRRSEAAKQAISARVATLSRHTMADPTATLERWFGQSPTGADAEANRQCRLWLQAMHPQHYAAAYSAFARTDAPSDKQLVAITCPALFMTGELEPNSTPAMSKAMSNLVPHSQCCIIDGARHMMSLTHGSAVEQALIAFFEGDIHARQR